ncbi:MAG: glycosyltransferase [Ilumatobacter sp.]
MAAQSGTVGYYVHHHGAGHAARFTKIKQASDQNIVPISELPFPGGVQLPTDVVSDGSDPTAGGALHWAPVGAAGSANRSLVLGWWLTENRPSGVVVDVSVEATLMCRLFGIPTIVMRQHGNRSDPAHEAAFRSARRLIAPFPKELEHGSTPAWVRQKTMYAGFIVDDPSPRPHTQEAQDTPGRNDIVVLWGAGGGALTTADLTGIVAAAGDVPVWFAGARPRDLDTDRVRHLGWVDDVGDLLRNGPTVVGSAGNNVVADAAATGCALVVVPQDRPFGEQDVHAESLGAAQAAAVVSRGSARNWQNAFELARARRHNLAVLAGDLDGASNAASCIDSSLN